MNHEHEQGPRVNDTDRCRLGQFLNSGESLAWGDPRCRANLEDLLEEAEPVAARATPEDLVTMNTRVRLAAIPTDKQRTVTLVYPEDVDLPQDGISVLDPLGASLLGSKVGDVVQCPDNACRRRFRIVEIIYQPERGGAYHL